MSDDQREALALHVTAMGYPNAAAVIRAGDRLDVEAPAALDELPTEAGQ